jgi:membrane protease YdiL (CAAX protease family)
VGQSSTQELTLGFVLGTFQTCVLVFVALVVLFLADDLGNQLDGLSTLLGIALFLVLWLTTCYFTLCAWRQLRVDILRRDSLGRMMLYGMKWGGLEGMVVALTVVVFYFLIFLALGLAEGGLLEISSALVFSVLGAIFGGTVGMAIGGFLGLIAAVIEAPLVYLAQAVAGEAGVAGQQDAPAE